MNKRLVIGVLVFLAVVGGYVFCMTQFRLGEPGNLLILPSVMLAAFCVYYLFAAPRPAAAPEERVEQLAAGLSRLRAAFVAVLVLLLLVVNFTVAYLFRSGAFQVAELRVDHIKVVGGGEGWARTLIDAHGLSVLDKDEKTRVQLQASRDGTAFVGVLDDRGRQRARMVVLDDGAPAVVLLDADGASRAYLANPASGPHLQFANPDGKGSLLVGSVNDRGFLLIGDRKKPRLFLGFDDQGGVLMGIPDEAGKDRFLLRVPQGGPQIDLMGPDGKLRLRLAATKDEPALRIYDADGKPIDPKP